MPVLVPGFSSCPSLPSLLGLLKTNTKQHNLITPAPDPIEIEEKWFDAVEDLDDLIPVTEDARRCMKQLISEFGEIKQNELIFSTLLRCFPSFPAEVINAAYHLYTATLQGKNIDFAVLNTLGLASSYLLADGNIIARVAQFIHDTISDTVGEYLLNVFRSDNSDSSSASFFTALAVLAITAKYYWRNDNSQPQRPALRISAFLGHILLRASAYWNQLEHIARTAAQSCNMRIADKPDIKCVMELNRHNVSARISNQQSWLCEEKNDAGFFTLKPVTQCDFTYTPEELRALQEKGNILFSRTGQHGGPTGSNNAGMDMAVNGTASEDAEIFFDATDGDSVPLTSAGADSTAIEMTSLILPLTAATSMAHTGGLSRGMKIVGTLGAAAVGGLFAAYWFSGKDTVWQSAPPQPEPVDAPPVAHALNDHNIVHFTPQPLPPPPSARQISAERRDQGPYNGYTRAGDEQSPNRVRRHVEHWERRPATTAQPDVDNVKIKKLFDFSCLEIRNNMTFAAGLRAFGKGLSTTIGSMARESQVVHTMNTKGTGCPDPKSVEELDKITQSMDKSLNTIFSLSRHFAPVAILKNIVGPVAEMAADDLEGKEIDPAERAKAFLDMSQMIQQMFATLTPEETMKMFKTPDDKTKLDTSIKEKFAFEKGKARVTVNEKKYELHTTKQEGMPYIEDEAGDAYYFIKYNKKTERWDKLDENIPEGNLEHFEQYKEIQEKVNKFSMPLDKTSIEGRIEILKDDAVPELFKLRNENNKDVSGVFINNAFIPVERLNVNNQLVPAALPVQGVRATLKHTDYGWTFEKKSVAIGRYAQILLESPGAQIGQDFTAYHWFTPINQDGLCHDNLGNTFLKKDDKYFRVDIADNGIKLHESPGSLIKREDDVFFLKSDEEMLFGLNPVPVGAKSMRHFEHLNVKIEAAVENYLIKYAEFETADITSLSRIRPALYHTTPTGSKVFITEKGARFKTSMDTEEYIDIVRKDGGKIRLYMMGNVYVRQRNEKYAETFSYEQIDSCRVKRAPGSGACGSLPVMMENSLLEALNKYHQAGRESDISMINRNLLEDEMVPGGVIYRHTMTDKSYFLHKGKFFETAMISPKDEKNPTGKITYKIWASGSYLTQKKHIDTVVIEQLPDQIKIRSQSTYMAETLNVSGDMASEYIKSSQYTYTGGLRQIEDALNAVRMSNKFYIGELPKEYAPDFTQAAIDTKLREMYPERLLDNFDYDIHVYGLNDNPALFTDYQKSAQEFFKTQVNVLKKHILPTVIEKTKYIHSNEFLAEYFKQLFGFNNIEFHNNFGLAIRDLAKRMLAALSEDKIMLMSIKMKKEVAAAIEFEDSEGVLLTDQERSSGLAAFMAPDKNGVMYINVDKTYVRPGVSFKPGADLMSVLLHELTHAEKMTTDYFYLPRTPDGYYIPASDAIVHIINKIDKWEILQVEDFKKRSDEYFKNIAVYRNKLSSNLKGELAIVAANDPGFLGHILINNADTAAMLINDIFDVSVYGMSDIRPENSLIHIRPDNKFGSDELGTIYNSIDGDLIKEYDAQPRTVKGTPIVTSDKRFISRADIALNNAECLNAIFGEGSAIAITGCNNEFQAAVKFRRIPGEAVTDIIDKSSSPSDVDYKSMISYAILAKNSPAERLSNKLVNSGVIVYDTSLKNLYYDQEEGFNFFSYDMADIWPDKNSIPPSEITRMKMSIKVAIASLALRMGINFRMVQKELSLPDEYVPIERTRRSHERHETAAVPPRSVFIPAHSRVMVTPPLIPAPQKSTFDLLLSRVEQLKTALKPGWYHYPDSLEQANTLKLETEKALDAKSLTPEQANRLSANIARIRQSTVDIVINALQQQIRKYSDPVTGNEVFFRNVIQQLQSYLDAAKPVFDVLYALGAKLNPLVQVQGYSSFKTTATTTSTQKPKNIAHDILLHIDDLEKALNPDWYKNELILNQAKALQSEMDIALSLNAFTPLQASTQSARLRRMRQTWVDNVIFTLGRQKKSYTTNSRSTDNASNQLMLQNIQKEIDIVNSLYKILYDMSVKLNRV